MKSEMKSEMEGAAMQGINRLWGLVALALTIAFVIVFAQFAQQQDRADSNTDEVREEIELAIKELRYRDALTLFERLEKRNEMTFRDRDTVLSLLEKLREGKELSAQLERYLTDVKDPFENALLTGWKVKVLAADDLYRNWGEIHKIHKEANRRLFAGAGSAERREAALRYFIGEIKFHTDHARRQIEPDFLAELAKRAANLQGDEDLRAEVLYLYADYLDKQYRWEEKHEQTIKAYQSVVNRFPKTCFAPKAQLQIGELLRQKQKYLKAIEEFKVVSERWPDSESAELARKKIEFITAPRLQANVEEVFNTAGSPFVFMRYRNIAKVNFAAYKIELDSLFLEHKKLEGFLDKVNIGSLQPSTTWQFDWDKTEDHAWRQTRVDAPIEQPGAYLVVASGGGRGNRTLMLISDLAQTVRYDHGQALVFAADAQTGEPITGARVTWALGQNVEISKAVEDPDNPDPRLRYIRPRYEMRYNSTQQLSTDEHGIVTIKLGSEAHNHQVFAMVRDGDHYALARSHFSYWNSGAQANKSYVYTDRPVYRPDQKVHFRVVIRDRDENGYKFTSGEKLNVTIYDARNNEVEKLELTLGEFGTADGTIELAEDAALGAWRIHVVTKGQSRQAQFRVEEYKKPEYEVTVAADKSQVRLGQAFKATVSARYYFGEPVAGAAVEFTIRQQYDWGRARPVGEYEWLYGSCRQRWYGGGRIVHRGTGTLDADGKLAISQMSKRLPNDDREYKVYRFSIEAKVVDESRRQIEGSGGGLVTSHEFAVNVRGDRYSYTPGQNAFVKFTTRRYDGAPVVTEGQAVLYKAEWHRGRRDYDLTRIWSGAAKTDEKGEGSIEVPLSQEGYFFITYETVDGWDQKVSGRSTAWVTSGRFRADFFPNEGLDIMPDKEHYRSGDTARLLISSTLEDSWALLTVEAESILEHRIVRLQKGITPVEVSLDSQHQPNAFIKLHAVNGFALYQTSKELRVPAVEKFASVVITPSKGQYKPGEKGTYLVEVKDEEGKPLQAAFSIGVIDSSLYYFARESTADIRKFFYGDMRRDSVAGMNSFQFRFIAIQTDDELEEDAMKAGAPEPMMLARQERALRDATSPDTGEAEAIGGKRKKDSFVQPELRSEFRDSALWLAEVVTGPDGRAEVEIEWPDNLTQWHTIVRAVTKDTIVGSGEVDVITRKNLMVRLQTPRFLVQGDRVTLSANVNNYLDSEKTARVSFEVEGAKLINAEPVDIRVPAGGQRRVDVEAVVEEPGTASVTVSALTDEESDAMKLSLPVLVHGIEKFVGAAGRAKGSETFELMLPSEIRPGSASLRISVSPTVAGVMLESLPYLVNYPYGCVEQTMSRFLPAAMVGHTLRKLGLPRPELEKKLKPVIAAGLDRLYDFQHSDGGWGWWKGGNSSPYMTAYVYYGLKLTESTGTGVRPDVLRRASAYLKSKLEELANSDEIETLNFILFALSRDSNVVDKRFLNRIEDLLPRMKEYETALFATALHNMSSTYPTEKDTLLERYKRVLNRLNSFAKRNERYGTASWGNIGGWYWYQDNVEATALALMANLRSDISSELTEGAVRWLLSVRKGGKWKSTRDTAFALYALSEYIDKSGEFDPNMTVTVSLNGQTLKHVQFTRENLFDGIGVIDVPAEVLQPGNQRVSISVEGGGNCYYDAFMEWFSLEEPITPAETTIAVERKYWKVDRVVINGREDLRKTALKDGDPVNAGDEILVELTLRSDNNYEYLVYEDYKPAGCEAVQRTSGNRWSGILSHMELRDEKVAFFIEYLPQGERKIEYLLRAEAPGRFHALPTNAYAMYAPDIRAISAERIFTIEGEK